MKKTVFTLALLLMAMVAGAQTVKVDFHKGDVRKYSSKTNLTLGVPMQGEQNGSETCQTTYTVTDATPDGYIVEFKTDSYETSGSAAVLQQFQNSEYFNALKNTPAKLKLDKNGQIVDLLNSDDILINVSKLSVEAINKLYADHPEIEKGLPKSKMLLTLNDKLTKENAINFFKEGTVLGLNGRDLKANPEANETFFNNFKVKTSYIVSDNNGQLEIAKTMVNNMNEDDTKNFLKGQIGQLQGGEISDADFEQIWSQLKMVGMTRISIDGNATSTFGNDGWLTSDKSDISMKAMGASVKISTVTTQE